MQGLSRAGEHRGSLRNGWRFKKSPVGDTLGVVSLKLILHEQLSYLLIHIIYIYSYDILRDIYVLIFIIYTYIYNVL